MQEYSKHIHSRQVDKKLLVASITLALLYIVWWINPNHVGNPVLYSFLVFGEIYHVAMAILFSITVWPKAKTLIYKKLKKLPSVDIFITVAGEPLDVVKNTVLAAKNINYENTSIHILNDGFVANKDNWKDMEILANQLEVNCITRKIPGGAKAGNINHALNKTNGEIIVIFDADMAAFPDFLIKVLPYFEDEKTGFVQTPQFYSNQNKNDITSAAWEQQEFFFGPVMEGKDNYNSAFICGTNVAIRRTALVQVGGMYEESIAEDFLTSLFIHQNGWRSHYTKEVLSTGLAPEDLLSYYKQQFRWARGSLQVLFGENPIFKKGLSLQQKLQYLSSSLFYFNGLIILIDALMPLIYLYTGIAPVATTTTSFAIFFLPFITISMYLLYSVSRGRLSYRAIAFTQSSFVLQISALFSVIFNRPVKFSVTPKKAQQGNYIHLAYPHILYILLSLVGFFFAINREGINPSVGANISWALFNIFLFVPFITSSIALRKKLDPNLAAYQYAQNRIQ